MASSPSMDVARCHRLREECLSKAMHYSKPPPNSYLLSGEDQYVCLLERVEWPLREVDREV